MHIPSSEVQLRTSSLFLLVYDGNMMSEMRQHITQVPERFEVGGFSQLVETNSPTTMIYFPHLLML